MMETWEKQLSVGNESLDSWEVVSVPFLRGYHLRVGKQEGQPAGERRGIDGREIRQPSPYVTPRIPSGYYGEFQSCKVVRQNPSFLL